MMFLIENNSLPPDWRIVPIREVTVRTSQRDLSKQPDKICANRQKARTIYTNGKDMVLMDAILNFALPNEAPAEFVKIPAFGENNVPFLEQIAIFVLGADSDRLHLARGYTEEGECVHIEGVPVQFLPAYNALLEEALREARETSYEEVTTRVVRAEHLIAICLQTGRDKDRERVRIFREQAELDMSYLTGLLQRHGLEGKWKQWTP